MEAGFNSDELLSVVVRLHDSARTAQLHECLLSVYAQTYRPIEVLLMLQDFSPQAVKTIEARCVGWFGCENDDFAIQAHGVRAGDLGDARSRLLNRGIEAAQGKYVAFLDYDDVMYPLAYEVLIGALENAGASLAAGRVRLTEVAAHWDFTEVTRELGNSGTGSLVDLFREPLIPIHGLVAKRADVQHLKFPEDLWIEEDYYWLLQVVAEKPIVFDRSGLVVGEYRKQVAGGTISASGHASREGYAQASYSRRCQQELRERVRLHSVVLESLGVRSEGASLTVADAVRMSTRIRGGLGPISEIGD
jgi:hypothetical protein